MANFKRNEEGRCIITVRSVRMLSLLIAHIAIVSTIAAKDTPKVQSVKGKVLKSDVLKAGPDGKLAYTTDERGNRLPDFSYSGYMNGGVKIPDVPVRTELSPVENSEDDTVRIQKAIDDLSKKRPDANGFRGAILLKSGTYRVAGALQINASGIVLRGEGSGKNGTLLIATGFGERKHRRTLITVGNGNRVTLRHDTKRKITDAYVPVGTHVFTAEDTEGFKIGDKIILHRPSTAEWISDIGCDRLRSKWVMRDGKKVDATRQWKAGHYDLHFERVITKIDGNRVTIDAPVVHVLDEKFGGGAIYLFGTKDRVSRVGIEDLSLVAQFGEPVEGHPYGDPQTLPKSYSESKRMDVSEDHSNNAIRLSRNSENTWVRRVNGNYFVWSLVSVSGTRATVEDCISFGHAARISGGRRYPFMIDGQMNLVQRCIAVKGRHEFVNQAKVPGPNAFVDCLAVEPTAMHGSGPHHRYAVGNLYDNIIAGSQMESAFYGNRGSGHGWGGAQICFYNCTAPSMWVRAPSGAICWVIGHVKDEAKRPAPTPDAPRSLYLKQLEDRLGKKAVENVTTEAQRKGTIYELLQKQLDE